MMDTKWKRLHSLVDELGIEKSIANLESGIPSDAATCSRLSGTPETDDAWKPRPGETNAVLEKRQRATCKRLERERDALENKVATGVHSCGDRCQRPLCVLRRERDQARGLAEIWRDATCADGAPIPKEIHLPWEDPDEVLGSDA